MKLYERYGDKGYHTSIITTFGIDFDAYENIILPRLRGAGCYNNVLLADSRMLTYALDGASMLPRHAGRHYTISGVSANGVFHPKITIQLGRRAGRVMIASANVTSSGLAGNRELAGIVDCSAEESGERRIVAAAWQYINRQIDIGQQSLAYQIDWIRMRTPWLFDTTPSEGVVVLSDGTKCALLTSGATTGIGNQFTDVLDGQTVNRLAVMSPYWDDDLAELKWLISTLAPKEVVVFIDRHKQLFPGSALDDLPEAKLYDIGELAQNRFVHAKLFVAETSTADHVLYGSPNCTVAAMGTSGFAGANEEASLYRELPSRTILEQLGLMKLLNEAAPLQSSDLPDYRKDESLPLDQAGLRSPGRFECLFDTLAWQPPASMAEEPAKIELLDLASQALPATLSRLPDSPGNVRRYQITGLVDRPCFARLLFVDGSSSAPAVIMLVDTVRETVREARGKRAENAAAQLAEETEEGLWLLEVLNDLESAEAAQREEGDPGRSRTTAQGDGDKQEPEYKKLDYDQFIAGRRIRSEDHAVSRNSLAGTELSLVRNFLNQILSIGEISSEEGDLPNDEALAASLNLGDEVSDAETALESGEEFTPNSETKVTETDADDEFEKKKAAKAKATREEIAEAVNQFNKRIREKAKAEEITSFDVLRLRAVLTIVAAAGQPRSPNGKTRATSLQVLPLDDSGESWPMLMGRLLFTFFGGNHPAIKHVQIESIHDEIPDDILECWAACFWTIQTCTLAMKSHPKLDQNAKRIIALTQQAYALTGLRASELLGDRVMGVFNQMNERFSDRLGVDGMLTEADHRKTASPELPGRQE